MKLYLLMRLEGAWYDEVNGFVVSARTPQEARKVCQEKVYDDGPSFLDTKQVTCKLISKSSIYTKPQVVLRDFRAG